MSAPVTAIYAALGAILLLILAANVSRNRRQHGVSLGAAGNRQVELAMRVHANAVEYLLIGLLLLLLLELNGAGRTVLHSFGAGLLIARCFHAWGFSHHHGLSFGRFYGILATWLIIAGLAGMNLWQVLAH